MSRRKCYEYSIAEIEYLIIFYLKKLRLEAQKVIDNRFQHNNEILFKEIRQDFIDYKQVKRLTLFLKGTGCAWSNEKGGCTFCGFWNVTSFGQKITQEEIISQVRNTLSNYSNEEKTAEVVALYNDGSLLDDREVDFDDILAIIQTIKKCHDFRKIVLECKVQDISYHKIKAIVDIIGTNKLVLSLGFESANQIIRTLCVHKPFLQSIFEEKVQLMQSNSVDFIPLVFFKPPFLTEDEAISDAISSIQYLDAFLPNRIDIEMATVQPYTLVEKLWRNSLFVPPKLSSILTVIQTKIKLDVKSRLFISPLRYTPEILDYPENDMNIGNIKAYFEDFNLTQKISEFYNVSSQENIIDEKVLIERIKRQLETVKW